jgi:hypothetical protein
MRAVLVLALIACGSKPDPEAGRAERLEQRPVDVAAPGTTTTPVVAPLPDNPVELPAECTAYRAMADRLATCERLGEMRDVLRGEFAKSWQAWSALPRDERGEVAAQCKRAADALSAAVAASCGW